MTPSVKPTIRGLYLITDTTIAPPMPAVAAAIRGGARVVQYRDKTALPQQRYADAAAVRALCKNTGVAFIVNDDVALAQQVDADGVHLGRDDMGLAQARAQLGSRKIIGVSCYDDLARARAAAHARADYVAFGSFFPSPTKPHAVRAPIELLIAARAQLSLPIVAIGGITPENGAALVAAGADALAVITGVLGQEDIEDAARRYTLLFNEEHHEQ